MNVFWDDSAQLSVTLEKLHPFSLHDTDQNLSDDYSEWLDS